MNGVRGLGSRLRGRVTAIGAAAVLLVGLVVPAAGLAWADQIEWTQVGGDIEAHAKSARSDSAVSLSADGTRVAVGAAGGAGQVRVFDLVGSQWVQVGGDITGEGFEPFYSRGRQVSLSADGSRVAVGVRRSPMDAGYVRIFSLIGSSWVQVGADIDGEAINDFSGSSVSLSADGTVVAVGAPFNDGGGDGAGHVRIFESVGSAWVQVGADIDGEAVGDRLGSAVSISADGKRVAAGAIRNSDNPAFYGEPQFSGHTRIFDLVDGSWVPVGSAIEGTAGDRTGWSVTLSADGSRVAMGADRGAWTDGYVSVYGLNSSSWAQLGDDIYGLGSKFESAGRQVSLSADGSLVAIGSLHYDGVGQDFGRVGIFQFVGTSWIQLGGDIDGVAIVDHFGGAVSLSADGSRVAVAADRNRKDAGHVRVFDIQGQLMCVDKVVTIDMNMGAPGLGTAGDDVILGTPGDDVIDAGGGNDTVCAGEGDDVVVGGTGDDVMFGGPGDDVMRGNAGADSITGGPGSDRLLGGIDADKLSGGPGDDFLGGFGGDDVISGDDGNDTIFGGFGADTIDGDAGDDVIRGLIGDDIIRGGDGHDVLDGDRGNDTINGNDGDDTIGGGNANDTLSGDDGDDVVSGGKADDALSGGLGTDTCAGNTAIVGDSTDGTCEFIFSVP